MTKPLLWHERIWINFHFVLYLAFMLSGQGHIHHGPGLLVGVLAAVLAGIVVGIPTILINTQIFRAEFGMLIKYLLFAGVIVLSVVIFVFLELFVSMSIYFPWRGG